MKIKTILSSIILLGASLTTLSGCSGNGCDCYRPNISYDIEAIVYSEDMSKEMNKFTYSSDSSFSLSLNTTYVLDVYINNKDVTLNSDYEEFYVGYNKTYFELSEYQEKKQTGHLYYYLKGIVATTETTVFLYQFLSSVETAFELSINFSIA